MDTLLTLLGSSWDRSRVIAHSILARFPRPLAGYGGAGRGAARLAARGLRLSGSGRQRESDRGALVLRLVFGSYARGLGLPVPLLAIEEEGKSRKAGVGGGGSEVALKTGVEAGGGAEEEDDSTARFLEELCGVLSRR